MNEVWFRWLDWTSDNLDLLLIGSIVLVVFLILMILLFSRDKNRSLRRRKRKKSESLEVFNHDQVVALMEASRDGVEQLLSQYDYVLEQRETEINDRREEIRRMEDHISSLQEDLSLLENLPPELASQIQHKKKRLNYQMLFLGIFLGLVMAALGGSAYVYGPSVGLW